MSRTYLALLHYDGRAFVGWQRQAAGRSVQGEVEAVLERLCGRRIVAYGAGRTDAGVHAAGLGVSVTVPASWTADALRRALNGLLPHDCWVERVSLMVPGFHARKQATGRRYRYMLGTDAAAASPFRRPYEWALGRTLDQSLLQQSVAPIRGLHCFTGFAVRKPPDAEREGQDGSATTTVVRGPYDCTIRLAEWEPRAEGHGYILHIAADRFLHHMVRFLVGTMVDIALGRRPLDDMTTLLSASDNSGTSAPAPPQGLYFIAAEYPAACFSHPPETSA
jgi:tRNA pseudouridine38-40 synthase